MASVERRSTRFGDPMLVLTIGRKKIYFFEPNDVSQQVAIGDTVLFGIMQKGDYWNGKRLAVAKSVPHPSGAFFFRDRWISSGGKVTLRGEDFHVYYSAVIELVITNKNIGNISDLEVLANVTELEKLDLEGNAIADITGLETLTNLQCLKLSKNRITQITGLEHLTNLRELDLGNNNITQITGLDSLENLQNLTLGSNQISKIEGLAQLKMLKTLDLGCNKITEIKGLENLTRLNMVNLKGNPGLAWLPYSEEAPENVAMHLHKDGFIKGPYRPKRPKRIHDPDFDPPTCW